MGLAEFDFDLPSVTSVFVSAGKTPERAGGVKVVDDGTPGVEFAAYLTANHLI